MKLHDFIIHIRDFRRLPDRIHCAYNLEVYDSPMGRQTRPSPVVYNAAELQDLLYFLTHYEMRLALSTKDVEGIGRRMADKLLHPTVLFWLKASLFQTLIKREGLRITFLIDDPAVAAIPWEYLNVSLPRFRTGVLALNPLTPVVRDQSFFGAVPELDLKSLRRNLFSVAEPATLSDLDEWFGDFRILSQGDDKKIFKALKEPDPKLEEFRKDLLERGLESNNGLDHFSDWRTIDNGAHKEAENAGKDWFVPRLKASFLDDCVEQAESFDVFCFYGHGGHRLKNNLWRENFPKDAGFGVLALEREDSDEPHFYLADDLARKLRKLNVKVAVICACKSGYRDTQNLWADLAPTLLERGRVPVVVAVQHAISKMAAFTFTKGFFQALAMGYTVEQAVTFGRIAIRNLNARDSAREKQFAKDWGLPVLYIHARQVNSGEMKGPVQNYFLERYFPWTGAAPCAHTGFPIRSAVYERDDDGHFSKPVDVYRVINDWLADPEGKRTLRISGAVGSGKTFLAAHLAEISEGRGTKPEGEGTKPQGEGAEPQGEGAEPEGAEKLFDPQLPHLRRGFLTATHFFSAQFGRHNSADALAESLALQLAARSREYADIVHSFAASPRRQGPNAYLRFLSDSFLKLTHRGLLDDIVILIDGLDEAEDLPKLLKLVASLPRRVRFIVTANEGWTGHRHLRQHETTELLLVPLIEWYIDDELDHWENTGSRFYPGKPSTKPEKEREKLHETLLAFGEHQISIIAKFFEWIRQEELHPKKVLAEWKCRGFGTKRPKRPCDSSDVFYEQAIGKDIDKHEELFRALASATNPLRADEIVAAMAETELAPLSASEYQSRLVEVKDILHNKLDKTARLFINVVDSLVEGQETYSLFHSSLANYIRTRTYAVQKNGSQGKNVSAAAASSNGEMAPSASAEEA